MNFEFNYNSSRSRKSRFYVKFSDHIKLALEISVALLFAVGIGLWFGNTLFGSLVLALAIILALPLIWYENDIKKMQPKIEPKNGVLWLEEALLPEVAGKLKSIECPFNLWLAVKDTWQQQFFCIRYGVPVDLYESLSKEATDVQSILQHALDLSQHHGENQISIPSLMVALFKTHPSHAEVLGVLGLDEKELETSIDWLHHNEEIIRNAKNRKHTGGLARDWTFGYTPTLNSMANNISRVIERGGHLKRDTAPHQATVNEMIKFMSKGRQNVLLVGEVGVGKTTTVYSFAESILNDKTVPEIIRYNQVFSINPSSIIGMSNNRNQVEMAVYKIISEAHKSKNAILFFDDAASFFQDGNGAIDISKVILPIINNGAVPIIMSMTPSEWQNISVQNQAMTGSVNYLAITEPDRNSVMRVLENHSLKVEHQSGVFITYQSLVQAIDLSDRYINDIAYPGKAIKLLENSINHAEGKLITAKSVQQSVEVTYGVKVQVASGLEKQELLNLEDQIHQHMINQTRAVKVVSDALRRSRSGVSNPDKPIGTFLFLGPTGVGKTELSKAVASVYFGDVGKIVRVDMNEFTQSSDVGRLLDISSSTSFLSEVGRNRHTVVLFDEIEKAHPEVVNVFLQLLDEGVMRDVNNKKVSFKDAIIIATSNAGADLIRKYIEAGQEVEQFEQEFINTLIDSNIFKAEFLNRFDESVVFRPLKPEELMQVVDLLLADVNKNLSKQKVAVNLTQEAKWWLVQQGYDPRLGARPLRRMVQRTVENVVAKKILQSDFRPSSTLQLDVADLETEATN